MVGSVLMLNDDMCDINYSGGDQDQKGESKPFPVPSDRPNLWRHLMERCCQSETILLPPRSASIPPFQLAKANL